MSGSRRSRLRALLVTSSAATSYSLIVTPATFSLTLSSAQTLTSRQLQTTAGTFTSTGASAQTLLNRSLQTTQASFVLTGSSADLTYVPSAIAYALDVTPASFTLTGTDAQTLFKRQIDTTAAAFVITGQDAQTLQSRLLDVSTGSISVTGQNADLQYTQVGSYLLDVQPAEFVITGSSAETSYQQSAQARLAVAGGRKSYVIKGRRYLLNKQELASMLAQMLEEVNRQDIKLDDPVKPKNLSRKSWQELKKTLHAIEASISVEAEPIIRKIEAEVINEEDDEEVLLALY